MSSVTWAIGVSVYAVLARRYSPYMVSVYRAFASLPFYLVWVLIAGGGFQGASELFAQASTLQIGWLALSVFASYALGDVFFMLSARSLGVPSALAIASTYPLLSAFFGFFYQGEKIGVFGLLGLVAVVGGTAIVILSSEEQANPQREKKSLGVLLAFLTSLAWALNTYSVAKGTVGLPTPVANAIRMIATLVFCPVFGRALTVMGPMRFFSRDEIKKYGWAFVLEACLGASFFAYGLSHAPLGIASALTSLAPVLSLPVAVLWGTEIFSWRKSLGVVLVVVGIIFLVGGA